MEENAAKFEEKLKELLVMAKKKKNILPEAVFPGIHRTFYRRPDV